MLVTVRVPISRSVRKFRTDRETAEIMGFELNRQRSEKGVHGLSAGIRVP